MTQNKKILNACEIDFCKQLFEDLKIKKIQIIW